MLDIGNALAEQGIRLRSTAVGTHKAVCPSCSHQRKKKNDPCLSVTIEDDDRAVWNCHHCQWTGNAGGRDYQSTRPARTFRRPERPADPQRPDKLFDWFAGRGVSRATVEAAGVYRTRQWFPQTDGELDCIAFPYEWAGVLRNTKYRSADKHFRQEKDPEPVLYNADSIAAGEDLVICEGEIDVLSFIEAGMPRVVSLPNGAPAKAETSDRR